MFQPILQYTHVVDRYMRQVLDETMRCSILAPYASRYQDIDIELGGHKVPAGVSLPQLTCNIHNHGEVLAYLSLQSVLLIHSVRECLLTGMTWLLKPILYIRLCM